MKPSQIAAQLYTLRDYLQTPADIAATMKRVKAIGYDAVQLSGLGAIDPQELANILQREGLTAAATHTSYDRLVHDLPAVIDDHHRWGCKHVAIGSMPGEFHNTEGYPRFAEIGTEVARKLDAANLTFSYHNHSFEFEKYDEKFGMDILFERADPKLFKFEIDTYWVQHGGCNPVTWIEKMRGRMPIVHFKDMAIADGQQVMAEVGEGNLEWPQIIAACREIGVEWYAVEQDVCRRDPFESLAISLRNLHALIATPI